MSEPVSRQRRSVLSEEEYTATLSSIVQRDFFPELPELERHAAVLERRAQGDVAGAVAVRRAARRLQQHEKALTAAEQDEDNDWDEDDVRPVRRRARPLHQESITGFHRRATNEDDEEFDSNQKRDIKGNRERLDHLFRASKESVPLLTNMASDDFQAEPYRIPATEWNNPSIRNGFFFSPTPLLKQDCDSEGTIKQIASDLATSSSKSPLALMPPPARTDGKRLKPIPKHQMVEFVPKHFLEQRIEPSQTRFPDKIVPLPRNAGIGVVATSDLENETDGSMTDASTDLDAPLRSIDEERRHEQHRQKQTHQSYVAMTPLIVPGTAGNESPIMTWGTVDSTPMVISGQETGGQEQKESSYSMAGESEKDRAARKAEAVLAQRAKRARTGRQYSSNKRSSSSARHATSLTPGSVPQVQKARQKIPSRSSNAFASSLRSSYTPKVRSESSSSSVRGAGSRKRPADNAFNTTPLASKSK